MQRFRAAFCIVCRKHAIQKTVSGSNLLSSADYSQEAFPSCLQSLLSALYNRREGLSAFARAAAWGMRNLTAVQ